MKEKTFYPEEKSMWGHSTWCGGNVGFEGLSCGMKWAGESGEVGRKIISTVVETFITKIVQLLRKRDRK